MPLGYSSFGSVVGFGHHKLCHTHLCKADAKSWEPRRVAGQLGENKPPQCTLFKGCISRTLFSFSFFLDIRIHIKIYVTVWHNQTLTKASKAAAWSQTTDCCVAAAGVLTASLLISVRCEGGVRGRGSGRRCLWRALITQVKLSRGHTAQQEASPFQLFVSFKWRNKSPSFSSSSSQLYEIGLGPQGERKYLRKEIFFIYVFIASFKWKNCE